MSTAESFNSAEELLEVANNKRINLNYEEAIKLYDKYLAMKQNDVEVINHKGII